MARSEHQLLSRPHEVLFRGFRSNTLALQQAGWQLSVNYHDFGDQLTLAMHNKDFGGYMVADTMRHNYFREDNSPLQFVVRRVNADILIYQGDWNLDFSKFEPIDARPQMQPMNFERKSIRDFAIFASQLVRTEEIIIEPSSVSECLDLIRRLQAPALAEVRERDRTREFTEAKTRMNFHAQVMSLAA